MVDLERRVSQNKVEVRADDSKVLIQGYSALFNSPTVIWDFEEVIAPGAFKRALSEQQDIRALFNHDSNYVLGRTKNGTLILREDENGLWMENEPPRSPLADSIVENIRRGDVDGQSFAFTVKRQEWQFEEFDSGKMDRRIITEIGIMYDVGPVTYPAYATTSVKLRNEAKKMHEEARSRWEQRRCSVAVPSEYGLSLRECRSAEGSSWEADEEKQPAVEEQTPAPIEPEAVEQTGSTEEGTPPAEAGDTGTSVPEGVDDPIVEASLREIEIKRRRLRTAR